MRLRPAISALLFSLLPTNARGEVVISAGTEHFAWSEDTSPFKVQESGPRFALGLALVQARAVGLRFAYRGRIDVGEVSYAGARLFDRTVAASGRTMYTGTTQRCELR